jgi:CHAD domain-containing protein
MAVVKPDKASKNMNDCALDEASALLRQIAGNRGAGESMKAVLRRVASELSDWTYSRVRAVWYSDPRARVRSAEIEQLRQIANGKTKDSASGNELHELRQRIARLERLLEAASAPLDR